MRSGVIVYSKDLKPYEEAQLLQWTQKQTVSSKLLGICEIGQKSQSTGAETTQDQEDTFRTTNPGLYKKRFSGRQIRRLPVLAHSQFIRSNEPCSLEMMLEALSTTAEREMSNARL